MEGAYAGRSGCLTGTSSTPASATASSRSGAVTTAWNPSPSFQMLAFSVSPRSCRRCTSHAGSAWESLRRRRIRDRSAAGCGPRTSGTAVPAAATPGWPVRSRARAAAAPTMSTDRVRRRTRPRRTRRSTASVYRRADTASLACNTPLGFAAGWCERGSSSQLRVAYACIASTTANCRWCWLRLLTSQRSVVRAFGPALLPHFP